MNNTIHESDWKYDGKMGLAFSWWNWNDKIALDCMSHAQRYALHHARRIWSRTNAKTHFRCLFFVHSLARTVHTRPISIVCMRKTVACHCNHIRIFMEVAGCRMLNVGIQLLIQQWLCEPYVCCRNSHGICEYGVEANRTVNVWQTWIHVTRNTISQFVHNIIRFSIRTYKTEFRT